MNSIITMDIYDDILDNASLGVNYKERIHVYNIECVVDLCLLLIKKTLKSHTEQQLRAVIVFFC